MLKVVVYTSAKSLMDHHVVAPIVASQICATILSFCFSKFEKLFPERQIRGFGKYTKYVTVHPVFEFPLYGLGASEICSRAQAGN